jgi:U3 small nucleolar RNA-associated protein 11
MTSSLRNSLHRRNHKERAQPAHRAKFGLLEKHKDYVMRARDYHSNQDRLTRLKQKAADRNKDEFYFRMNSEKTTVCFNTSLWMYCHLNTF